ncbi:MAG: DUF5668 domain-containing protein [Candidatus Zixiibacteriota bacterium]
MKDNAIKFWGVVLFVVGLVFLLSNYALIIPQTLSKLWPVVLLGIGLKLFFTKGEQVNRA